MLLLPVLLVSGTLLGQPTEDDGVTVSLQFSKQSLETVVSALAKAGNMTIVLGGDLQKKEISAFFTDTPIDQVLETIAASQELQVVREGGCILLVTRKEFGKATGLPEGHSCSDLSSRGEALSEWSEYQLGARFLKFGPGRVSLSHSLPALPGDAQDT